MAGEMAATVTHSSNLARFIDKVVCSLAILFQVKGQHRDTVEPGESSHCCSPAFLDCHFCYSLHYFPW